MGVEDLEGNNLAGFRVVRLMHTTLTAGCDVFEDTVSANCSLLTHRESSNAIVATSISDGDGDDKEDVGVLLAGPRNSDEHDDLIVTGVPGGFHSSS